jgi:hypothetical protein
MKVLHLGVVTLAKAETIAEPKVLSKQKPAYSLLDECCPLHPKFHFASLSLILSLFWVLL